jgi:hypothetical protein
MKMAWVSVVPVFSPACSQGADPADVTGGEVGDIVAVEAAAEGAEGEHDAVGVAVGSGRSRYWSTRTRSFPKTTP